jgi:peptidoglycan/LPS O-acetylase OafA/YrhL
VFVTLGQQSLGAFVLHVYGILLVAHLPSVFTDGLWTSTLVQLTLILSIAVLLNGVQRWPLRRPAITTAPARPVTA